MQPNETKTIPPTQNLKNEEIVDPAIPAGDHIIIIIRRHPFGLIAMYLEVAFGLLLSFGLLFFLVPQVTSAENLEHVKGILAIIAVAAVTLSALFLIIITFLYRQNRWVITDDTITQVLRNGIFGSQISGLSMANIEDVTSEKQGPFQQFFNFGTIKVETAGEQPNKFHFYYCPRPEVYAKILLDTREKFIEDDPAGAKRGNDLLNVPGTKRT